MSTVVQVGVDCYKWGFFLGTDIFLVAISVDSQHPQLSESLIHFLKSILRSLSCYCDLPIMAFCPRNNNGCEYIYYTNVYCFAFSEKIRSDGRIYGLLLLQMTSRAYDKRSSLLLTYLPPIWFCFSQKRSSNKGARPCRNAKVERSQSNTLCEKKEEKIQEVGKI